MLSYDAMKLGKWNLADLVPSSTAKEVAGLHSHIESKVSLFEGMRPFLKPEISVDVFVEMIHMIEEISEELSILAAFAHLQYYSDTSSNDAAAFMTRIEKFCSEMGNRLIFFDLWFKKDLDITNALRLIDGAPCDYKEYLRHKRLAAKYSLTEPEEKIINTLEVSGTGALVKIYDRMTNGFDFTISMKRGKKTFKKTFTNKEKLLSMVRSQIAKERENAYKALWRTYEKYSGTLGEIYQNLVLEWYDENVSLRGFKSPISVRNLSNNLDDGTVDALLSVCKRNSSIFQEYFIEKADILGIKQLRRYDLYAPISSKSSNVKKYRYGKAAELGTRNV